MTEPLPGVWVTRDYPVLRELARRFDAGHGPFEDHEIAEALQMDTEEVRRAGRALSRSGYVKTEEDGDGWLTFYELSGGAYRVTGLHPNGEDAIKQLVSLLRQASEEVADEQEQSRLRRAAGALGDASGKVLTGIATAWLAGVIPH